MTGRCKRPEKGTTAPHGPAGDAARLVIVPGLQTALGGPVLGLAGGSSRRPVLRALATFAALATQRGDEGAA
jgi:hypothetical protein